MKLHPILALAGILLVPTAGQAGDCKRVFQTEEAFSIPVKQGGVGGLSAPSIYLNLTSEGEPRLAVAATVNGTIQRVVPEGATATLSLEDGASVDVQNPKDTPFMPFTRTVETNPTGVSDSVDMSRGKTSIGAEFTLTDEALATLGTTAVESIDLPFHKEEGERWQISPGRKTQKALQRAARCVAGMKSGAEKPRTIRLD